MSAYEDIALESDCIFHELHTMDWNGDGFLDVLVSKDTISLGVIGQELHLYQYDIHRQKVCKIFGAFEHVNTSDHMSGYRLAIVDWDGDGDLDLILASNNGKLHYHEMVSGRLQREEPKHDFSNISVGGQYVQPLAVDWDNDGDMDLVLGPPDYRFFERMDNGSLKEWPLEQSPFTEAKSVSENLHRISYQNDYVWRFIDCDADGDFDLILLNKGKLQACEHVQRRNMHVLQCRDDFRCLGTSLASQELSAESFDLGVINAGQLNLITGQTSGQGGKARLWSAGFCVPKAACHQKGLCSLGETNCSCIKGHDLSDCSGCDTHFYTLQKMLGEARDCRACPGEGGLVCHGRGQCLDDAAAKATAVSATEVLMAKGNGSCTCSEAYFYGQDVEGRRTCADGMCPAGTEESDGKCLPCTNGSYSAAGGTCKKCDPGTFSSSSGCLPCLSGTVSKLSGMSACDECLPGKHEVNRQWCSDCPAGSISSNGDNSCSKCPMGFHAFAPGSIKCDLCPAGTFADEGSVECAVCPSGTISAAGNGNCSQCDAGRVARNSVVCELCPGGTFAQGSQSCQVCPVGHFVIIGKVFTSLILQITELPQTKYSTVRYRWEIFGNLEVMCPPQTGLPARAVLRVYSSAKLLTRPSKFAKLLPWRWFLL